MLLDCGRRHKVQMLSPAVQPKPVAQGSCGGTRSVADSRRVIFRTILLGLTPQAHHVSRLRRSDTLATWGYRAAKRRKIHSLGRQPQVMGATIPRSPEGATDCGCGVSSSHHLLNVCHRGRLRASHVSVTCCGWHDAAKRFGGVRFNEFHSRPNKIGEKPASDRNR
jgi:hypothetical protein